jgi:hypothetical protein
MRVASSGGAVIAAAIVLAVIVAGALMAVPAESIEVGRSGVHVLARVLLGGIGGIALALLLVTGITRFADRR